MATLTFSGIASGIDTESLIEATISQKRAARIEPLEERVSSYKETNAAFDDLKDMLSDLKDSLSNFRTLKGNGISMQAQSNDESILSCTISGTAEAGSYDILTKQLAKAGSCSLGGTFTSQTSLISSAISGEAADRTVSFNIGTGSSKETVNIEVTSSMTLSDFVTEFNNNSTKATASLINSGSSLNPNYVIMVRSKNEGSEEGNIEMNLGSATTSAFSNTSISQAQNAIVEIAGVEIERQSNKISDVIPGVTMELFQTGHAQVTVGSDYESTAQAIEEFVDCYNDILEYISENDEVSSDDDDNIIYGSLSKTSLDENIISALKAAFSSSHGTGSINILADIGITTERNGTLSLNSDTLKEAIEKNPNGVSAILNNLGDTVASTGGTIDQFNRYNGLIDSAINTNDSEISSLSDKITTLESNLSREEEALRKRFAALEAIMGELQQQQSSIAALLPSS